MSTLADRIAARAERAARRWLTDTCRITRPDINIRDWDTDPVTLAAIEPADTVIHDGRCAATNPSVSVDTIRAGDTVNATTFDLLVDVATDARPGDKVTITASINPQLVDVAGTVKTIDRRTHVGLRRCEVSIHERTV
ncbi:MAG: DUF6093 family protein [Actinomycetota bacterium]